MMIPKAVYNLLISFVLLFGIGVVAEQAQAEKPAKETVPNLTKPDRYRLQPNDVLEVQYRYSPEYNDMASIQPDGFVVLNFIGEVKIGGVTLEQAQKLILEKAAIRLKDPEVTVKLKEFEKPSFVVSGHVKTPGRYDLRGKVMLSEAIAIAGGFIESSKTSQVLLLRKLNAEWSEVIEVNLREDNQKKKFTEDISLRPGDMLIIPQNRISKIERFVKNVVPFNPMGILYRR